MGGRHTRAQVERVAGRPEPSGPFPAPTDPSVQAAQHRLRRRRRAIHARRSIRLLALAVSAAVVATSDRLRRRCRSGRPQRPTRSTPAASSRRGLPVCLPGQESAPRCPAPEPRRRWATCRACRIGQAGGTFAGVRAGRRAGRDGGAPSSPSASRWASPAAASRSRYPVATEQSSLRPDAINKDWLGLFQQNPVDLHPVPAHRTRRRGLDVLRPADQAGARTTTPTRGRTTRSVTSSRRPRPVSGSPSTGHGHRSRRPADRCRLAAAGRRDLHAGAGRPADDDRVRRSIRATSSPTRCSTTPPSMTVEQIRDFMRPRARPAPAPTA